MNREFEDQLNPEEQHAFERLPREKAPPPQLEDRVAQALRHSSLLGPARTSWRVSAPRVGLAVAASLLFFLLGAAAMKWLLAPPQKSDAPAFMLVLRETPEQLRRNSSEEEMRVVKEYGNWARQLSKQGVLAEGEKLKDEVRLVGAGGGPHSGSQIPTDQTREIIAGYFLITAQNYEQAVKVAETCPHLKYGGTIEVREIDRF